MKKLKKNVWKYIAVIPFALTLIIGFQNCQEKKNIINIASNSAPPVANIVEFLFLPGEVSDEEIVILADYFTVNSSVTFNLKAFTGQGARFEKYDSFEWSVSLHEDLGNQEASSVNQDDNTKITTQSNYKWSFDRTGVYDVLATLTSSEGEPSVIIGRTIIIGQCVDFPLEIQINDVGVSETTEEGSSFISASLPVDEKVFFVDRSDGETLDIDNGLWEVRHNGYRIPDSSLTADQYTQLTMTMVNILEGDVITLEFFTQLENANCITYTEKRYKMTDSGLSPLEDTSSTTTTTSNSTSTSITTTTL